MNIDASSGVVVRVARPQDRELALRLVWARPSDNATAIEPTEFLRLASEVGKDLDLLLVAERTGKVVAAIWANRLAGKCATVWPPQLVPGEHDATADLLFDSLESALAADGVHLAQSLVTTDDSVRSRRLAAHGFSRIAEIHYMACFAAHFTDTRPPGPLRYQAYRHDDRDQFALLLNLTHQGTMDCPALNGVRDPSDVLEGYEQTGDAGTNDWMFVQHGAQKVGCLLLADHADNGNCELVYMGLIPSARGRGWGQLVAQHAQTLTRQKGRQQLVLAVDASNRPAVDVYHKAGFITWDRSQVFVKVLARAEEVSRN